MKDFDIAKYLRENYEGPFKTFQSYADLKPLKEESEEQLDSTVPYEGPDPHLDGLGSSFDQVAPVEESDIQEAGIISKVFDLRDPESGEDALEWIYDNTNFEPETEEENEELHDAAHYAAIEDIIDYINDKISGHEIDYNMVDDDENAIEVIIKPTGATMKEDAYGPDTEQGQFDRMMGLAHKYFQKVSPIVKYTIDKLRADGFGDQDILDFMATDFSQNEEVTVSSSGVEMEEDTDNITAADNAAYGADQEIGEPI